MGGSEEVESHDGLWYEFVPQIHRERWVGTTEDGDEMIFERAYCTFSGVATVDLGGGKLKCDIFIVEVVDECFGAFVVQFLKAGAETSGD